MSKMLKIKVTPTRELFYSDDCYGIYGAKVNKDDLSKVQLNEYGNISIKGTIQKLDINREYEMYIYADKKGKYEGTYIINNLVLEDVKNIDVKDQPSFLRSVLTDNQFTNIYKSYSKDDDIVGMIKDNTFDYKKVKGVGEKNYINIQKKILSRLNESNLLVFLQNNGIRYGLIKPLLEEYKTPEVAMQKIKGNPYTLTKVSGIGFKKADEIASIMGYDMESPNRIKACIKFAIEEVNQNGDSWINERQLYNRVIEYLGINKGIIKSVLEENKIDDVICVDGKYTKESIYNAELYISKKIKDFNNNKTCYKFNVNEFLDRYSEAYEIILTNEQRDFFHSFNNNNICLLIGEAGSGKSFLQKALVDMCKEIDLSMELLCPTGRASKRLSEYTGLVASTIHRRILKTDKEGKEKIVPITSDVVIVDEASMCDIMITRKLFQSIVNTNTKIVIIGDSAQLASVGTGNILHDMMNSKVVHTTKLTKVFRQSEGGMYDIITKTRKGEKFLKITWTGRKQFGKDCVFLLTEQENIKRDLIDNYKNVLKQFNADDVVVATPTNRGVLGTVELNREIQKIVNPRHESKKEQNIGNKINITFRVGDLVMNQQNMYNEQVIDNDEKEVNIFNGEMGKIVDINTKNNKIIVDFEVGRIGIDFSEALTYLKHAWVCTIHKLQGSQIKVVIVIADKSSTYQLNANLLYTGLSRAEKFLLVMTQPNVFNRALNKFENKERKSFLREMLISI